MTQSLTQDLMMSAIEEAISPQVRVMQIIVGAMIMSVLVLMVVVTTVLKSDNTASLPQDTPAANSENETEEAIPIVSYIGYGFGAMALVSSSIVGPLIRKSMVSQVPTPLDSNLGKTVEAYQSGLIISAAICEGGAFFNIIANMIDGQFASLAMAIILLIAIASFLPTNSRVANWIEDASRQRREQESFVS